MEVLGKTYKLEANMVTIKCQQKTIHGENTDCTLRLLAMQRYY